jgi:fructokinase
MFGGIETGGTKTVCAVGADGVVADRAQFPTGVDPVALADRCGEFFAGRTLAGIGVGTFGPCDPDPASSHYGHILTTPKPGWSGVDLLGLLAPRIAGPLVMTTDVTAAALGEQRYGAGRGLRNLVYLTIGTGVGGGAVVDGRILHGATHPEMGHTLIPVLAEGGVCPYHGNCLEGLAAGPALAAREGRPGAEIPDDDPAWDVEAGIVAAGLHAITCMLSPQCIIVGGGVGSRSALHSRLPALLSRSLAGYVPVPRIVTPGLGADAGVIGALALAQDQSQG